MTYVEGQVGLSACLSAPSSFRLRTSGYVMAGGRSFWRARRTPNVQREAVGQKRVETSMQCGHARPDETTRRTGWADSTVSQIHTVYASSMCVH